MKAVIPKSITEEIQSSLPGHKGLLFGRWHREQELIQVVSLEPNWRGLHLENIGTWVRALGNSIKRVNGEDRVVLYAVDNQLIAELNGREIPIITYDCGNYHSRHRKLTISTKLPGKKVAMIGVGTISSKAVKEFAKHGLELLLFDPETIEIENPYRMGLDQPPELLVGLNKCYAAKEAILMTFPEAKVHCFPIDISQELSRFCRIMTETKPDLIILSTDTLDSVRDTNAVARQNQIPVLHVVLSDGAESGQIHFTTSQPDAPCLLCMDSEAEAGAGTRDSRRQYAEEDSRAQHAVPSLSVDTTIIASIATKIALAYLAGEEIEKYFTSTGAKGQVMWFSTTPGTWILEDFAQKLVAIVEKNPRCSGCWKPDRQAILKKHKQRKEAGYVK